MIVSDFKCEKCGITFEVTKPNIDSEFNVTCCPECKYKLIDESDKTIHRKWSIGAIDVASGRLGNGQNGYNNEDVYMPSKFSTKRFKNSAMHKEHALELPSKYYEGN